jgi:hypothetical protein
MVRFASPLPMPSIVADQPERMPLSRATVKHVHDDFPPGLRSSVLLGSHDPGSHDPIVNFCVHQRIYLGNRQTALPRHGTDIGPYPIDTILEDPGIEKEKK